MHRYVLGLTLSACALAGGSGTAAAAATCPAATTADRLARELYEQGVIAESQGDLGAARNLYRRVVREHAGTPFGCWAGEKLDALAAGKVINKNGRAQFIIGATLFGAWSGMAIASLASLGDDELDDTESKALIWSGIGGAAAGLVPSILASSRLSMSTGRATLINFGWSWGLWHGLAISLLPDTADGQIMLGSALGGSVVGWTGTFLATRYLDVADGDAALIASSAAWFSWLSFGIGVLIGAEDFVERQIAIPTVLAGGDAALIGAAFLSTRLDISAGRVGLINLGGVLGAMVGGGIIALAEPANVRASVGIMLGSTVAALVITTWLTAGYDRPTSGATGVAVLERTADGWAWGLPAPRIGSRRHGNRQDWSLHVPLIGGQL